MAAELHSPVEDILSPTEIAALQIVHELYGGQAKLAAATLADTIDLDEPTRQQFMGSITATINGLDFESRREVSIRLREAAAALGGPAVEASQETIGLVMTAKDSGRTINENSTSSLKQDSNEIPDATSTTGLSRGGGENDVENTLPPPLSKTQTAWLSRILDAESIALFEELPISSRLVFARDLGRKYQSLRIPGLNATNSEARAHELVDLLVEDKSYEKIAALSGIRVQSASQNMIHTANAIIQRVSREEIIGMLPSLSEDFTEQPEVISSISAEQRKWYSKFLSDEDIDLIEGFTPPQIEQLISRLEATLCSFTIRRDGQFRTQRRVSELSLFIEGKTIDKIAESTEQNSAAVKASLHSTADILSRRMTPMDRIRVLQGAESFTTTRHGNG